MTTYNINFTDPNKSSIDVDEANINEDYSIKFPGRIRLEWGKDINENLLRLMENFASPSLDVDESIPDPAYSVDILSNPVDGQLWYNTTKNRFYKYSEAVGVWVPLADRGQVYAANWGQIQHGEQLPRPTTPSGYVFPYTECIWSVSPHNYLDSTLGMICTTDATTAEVNVQYRSKTQDIIIDGIANYLIIGIRNNDNLGWLPDLPLFI